VALSKREEIEREEEKREKGIESASWWMRSMRPHGKPQFEWPIEKLLARS
jgi:hypothetical protein